LVFALPGHATLLFLRRRSMQQFDQQFSASESTQCRIARMFSAGAAQNFAWRPIQRLFDAHSYARGRPPSPADDPAKSLRIDPGGCRDSGKRQ
jgi:hypothetical protein